MMSQSAFSQTTPAAESVSKGTPECLTASLVSVANLRTEDKARMFALIQKYYNAVTEKTFQADLAQKDAVILLRDRGALQGFSTLVSLQMTLDHKKVYGIFSGDTVIEKQYWGQRALPKAFLRYLFREKLKRPFSPLYWLLITKGYKTYLMMANNFSEHFPRYEKPLPARVKPLMDAFYTALYR